MDVPNAHMQPTGKRREEDVHHVEHILLTLSPVEDDLLSFQESKELLLVLAF
jgi:hypothetical protein